MRKILSLILSLALILTFVNVPNVSFAADSDLFADDFQTGYETGAAVSSSGKWNTAINAKVLEESENKFAAFYCEGTQYWPAMHKTVAMSAGQTTCFSGKIKFASSESAEGQSFYLEYRATNPANSSNRQNIVNFTASAIKLLGDDTKSYGSVVNNKWISYEVYITPGAYNKETKVDVIVDAVDENSLKNSDGDFTQRIVFSGSKVMDNIYVYQNNQANMVHNNYLKDTTSMAAMNYLDDVRIFNSDANLFNTDAENIKINGENIVGFDKDKTSYDIVLPFGTQSAEITAKAAAETSSVKISNGNVSEFPQSVSVEITSQAGTKKTYTLNIKRKSSENELESSLVNVKDGKDAIITMVYDDGHINTAEFNQTMFEKYDLRGSSVIITNQMTGTKLTRMQEVVKKGRIDVTSHSTTHTKIDSSYNTDEILKMELVDSKNYLTQNFPTVDTITFAPSNNTITSEGWEVVKENYYAMRSGNRGYNTLSPNSGTNAGEWYNLYMQGIGDVSTVAQRNAWIDNAITKKSWLIEMWHGIEEGGYQEQKKDDAQAHYEYISKKQDEGKVAVMTFNEATKYIRERQIATSSASKIDENSVSVNVTYEESLLPKKIFNYPLTVRVEVPDNWGAVSLSENGKTVVKSTFKDDKTYVYANVVPNSGDCIITKVENSNLLSNIRLNGESIKSFDSQTYVYNIEVQKSDLPITVSAKTQDLNAEVEITNETVTSLPATCTIKVCAVNGDEKTYTLNLTREKSNDATLKSITVDKEKISNFSSEVLSYKVKTDNEDTTTVCALANDTEFATVTYKVGNDIYETSSVSVKLPATIEISVKAENGDVKKYNITVESNAGDVLYLDDKFETYTENSIVDNSKWDGTNFSEQSGVRAQKENGNANNMIGYAFNVKGVAENQQLNKYIGATTTQSVVVSGRYKGITADTTSHMDILVRGEGVNLVSIGDISNSGSVKVGRQKASFTYENGKWVDYIYVINPGDGVYNVVAYFYGEGVGNKTYKMSANSTANTSADMSKTNCRILLRGNVTSGEGNGIYYDNIKIYSPGKFKISMPENINIKDGDKVYVSANHEIDVSTFDKNYVIVKDSSENTVSVSEIKTDINGFEVKFAQDLPNGKYTLSLTEDAKDIVGQKASNSVEFNVEGNAATEAAKVKLTFVTTGESISADSQNLSNNSTKEYEVGKTINLSAVGNGEFLYWKDAQSGAIVSYKKDFSFTPGSERTLAAIFATDGEVYVTFKNANGVIVANGVVSEMKVPNNPYVYGYKFDGWYNSGEKTELKAGEDVNTDKTTLYSAGYIKDTTVYTITIDSVSDTYTYNDKVTVNAQESKDGKSFSYWKRDGKIASYDRTYSFYASANSTLESVYGENISDKNVLVMAQPVMADESRIAFFAERNIDAENTVVETGILIGNSADLSFETSGVIKSVAQSLKNSGQYTVRKKNVSSGETWYARAYVIYSDKAGVVHTIYSNEVSKSI